MMKAVISILVCLAAVAVQAVPILMPPVGGCPDEMSTNPLNPVILPPGCPDNTPSDFTDDFFQKGFPKVMHGGDTGFLGKAYGAGIGMGGKAYGYKATAYGGKGMGTYHEAAPVAPVAPIAPAPEPVHLIPV